MTFSSPLTRTDPPFTNPELAALNSWLDYNRATLLSKLDGLTEEQAGRRMVGSDTTLHGIVRHMTTMEQFFFVECVAGQVEPYPYYDGEEVNWDWELDRSEGLQADVDRYLALCERSRTITAEVDPDATFDHQARQHHRHPLGDDRADPGVRPPQRPRRHPPRAHRR